MKLFAKILCFLHEFVRKKLWVLPEFGQKVELWTPKIQKKYSGKLGKNSGKFWFPEEKSTMDQICLMLCTGMG